MDTGQSSDAGSDIGPIIPTADLIKQIIDAKDWSFSRTHGKEIE